MHSVCIWMRLTVLVALPEVFQVFYVDEVVTGMSHDLCWGQIHILWDPVKKCNEKTYLSTEQKQVCLLKPPPGGVLSQLLMKKHESGSCNTRLKNMQYSMCIQLNVKKPLPVLTICDLQVHVDSEDKHLALHADFIKRGRRERVRQRHQTHRPTHWARGARHECGAAADSPCHVDYLTNRRHLCGFPSREVILAGWNKNEVDFGPTDALPSS